MKKAETRYFKITVTGTKQERKDQFKLLTEFGRMKVERFNKGGSNDLS